MKIWKKITLGFSTVILFLVATNYYSIRNDIQLIHLVENLESSKRVELNQSHRLAYLVQRVKSNIRELFLEIRDNNKQDEIIYARKVVEGVLSELPNTTNTLKEATIIGHQRIGEIDSDLSASDEIVLVDSLIILISSFESNIKKTLYLLDENKYSLATAMFEDNTEGISRDIQDILLILVKDAEKEVYLSIKQMDNIVDRTIERSIFITILCLFLAIGIGIYISKSISTGIHKLIDGTNEIVKGRLETQVQINTGDELRLLSNSFNNMAKELKEKMTTIDNLNKNLIESNKTKDTFFSIIAHDLRSPLGALLGLSELLSNDYNEYNDKDRFMLINQIEKAAKITFELLDNLLTWARSQSGRIQINKENVNLHDLVEKSLDIYRVKAIQKGIKLFNDIPHSTTILVDIFTLSVAINNTINNALKYTSNGGIITITAVSYSDNTELCIKDTGVGMSQETIDNLIKNNNLDSTPGTNNESGTGLGLILIKDFISRNDGKLTIKSEIGKGSEFRFLLPLSQDVVKKKD